MHIEVADVYGASEVPTWLTKTSRQVLQLLHKISCRGRAYICYASLLHRYDALQGQSMAEASMVLQGPLPCKEIKAVLEAEFGLCMRHEEEHLHFTCQQDLWVVLGDRRKLSAAPYVLDQIICSPEWIDRVQGLSELGHSNLPSLLGFPAI